MSQFHVTFRKPAAGGSNVMSAGRIHRHVRALCAVTVLATAIVGCREPGFTPPEGITLGGIDIVDESAQLERGSRDTLTATTLASDGDTVDVPVVWRSSNERVAIFERGGVLVARDTGVTLVTASALGVSSDAIPFQVVWVGPAYIDTLSWTRPHALMPGAALRTDSLAVRVLNVDSVPVRNALVAFTVTAGGGSVSPFIDTTDANGIAATQWTLGDGIGLNSVTAAVVRADSTLDPLVASNAASFSITAYTALSIQAGTGQTDQILASLPVQPSIRLVDSLGAPRAGIPVTFTASHGGRVTNASTSTNADGVATPGTWVLGDIPGQQSLEARVSDATIQLSATATGTPVRYLATSVAANGAATCARRSNDAVECWGEGSQTGTASTDDFHTPSAVANSLAASGLVGGSTHFCALTSAGDAWCWGANAMVDTSGATTSADVPTEMPTDLVFERIAPGFAHNCAIASDGIAYCWGQNPSGQLGDGTTTTRLTPAPVSGGFTFSRIASGSGHSCALTLGGIAFCWGANSFGQVGDATTEQRSSPTLVSGNHTFTDIGAGETFTCALHTDGRVFCWGDMDGIGGAAGSATPVTFTDAPTFVSLSVGAQHACALVADGSAYCWGVNSGDGPGRVGDNTSTNRTSPSRVETDLRFSQVSAGRRHTCAVTSDDQSAVACWGRNDSRELGNDVASFFLVPRYIVLGVNP